MILDQLDARPVIAHRGASGQAPENTMAALRLAVDQGADALEFDLRLSACGTPMLMHDALLDRTTGWTGPVRARTAAQLANCDAGHRFSLDGRTFPWRERGLGVPSLAQVLADLPELPLMIELKTAEAAVPTLEVLRLHGAQTRVMVASFLEEALLPFRTQGLLTSASRRGILRLWVASRIGLPIRGVDRAYSVPERYQGRIPVPTPGFVRAARRMGCPVHVWTVDDPDRARALWQIGVSGIVTNYPDRILAAKGSSASQ
jgi:glycerophosphoryl diester phosphodiesterase